MQILNLTGNDAYEEESQAGVVEPKNKNLIKQLLDFDCWRMPSKSEIETKAKQLAKLAKSEGHKQAMIEGTDLMIEPLIRYLKANGIQPVFSFWKREATPKHSDCFFQGFIKI